VRLAQLDGLRRTIVATGFSKVLVPQWRVGCVALPAALVDRVVDTKLLAGLTSPAPLEQAVAWCLEQGRLRRHAERIVARLDAARARCQRLALEAGCKLVTPPQGLFAWVDAGCDTDRLAAALLDEDWAIAPGSLFHATRRPGSLMRVNVAAGQEARFWRRIQALRPAYMR
jgi:DNA-binding transcriptional MocR family regulator